jgi:hypothetical protein
LPIALIVLSIAAVAAGGFWLVKRRPTVKAASLPDGYLPDTAALKIEYANYYGNEKDFLEASARFRSAGELAGRRNLPAVASALEAMTKFSALPIVFHNLGVAYAALGDYPRAADAFREALAHDQEYAPTRMFLQGHQKIRPGSADPYTRESEPNNGHVTANVIALRTPVGGEISGAVDSADYFRFSAPPAPRDLVAIEIANQSTTFAPRVQVYNSELRTQTWGEKAEAAGASIRVMGALAPNSRGYVLLSGVERTGGMYLLTVTPLKAFDHYEPNDEIGAAHRISIGEEVSANVMDQEDTDFFTFTSPRTGVVTIELRSRSELFAPMLAVYNSDRRTITLAPPEQQAQGVYRHSVNVEKDQAYYLQISSRSGAAGAYIVRAD